MPSGDVVKATTIVDNPDGSAGSVAPDAGAGEAGAGVEGGVESAQGETQGGATEGGVVEESRAGGKTAAEWQAFHDQQMASVQREFGEWSPAVEYFKSNPQALVEFFDQQKSAATQTAQVHNLPAPPSEFNPDEAMTPGTPSNQFALEAIKALPALLGQVQETQGQMNRMIEEDGRRRQAMMMRDQRKREAVTIGGLSEAEAEQYVADMTAPKTAETASLVGYWRWLQSQQAGGKAPAPNQGTTVPNQGAAGVERFPAPGATQTGVSETPEAGTAQSSFSKGLASRHGWKSKRKGKA